MTSLLTLLQNRRSTRKYTSEKVSQEKIDMLLKAALMSPASKSSNPWEFIVVTNPETMLALSQSKPHGATFSKSAPLAIVVCADPQKSDVWVEDTSIASIYLQLMAEELGLGSCWVQIHKRKHESGIFASDYIKTLLSIPQEYEVESFITIGYKEEERKPFDFEKALVSRIHKETFGGN